MQETGVPGENHRLTQSHYQLSQKVCPLCDHATKVDAMIYIYIYEKKNGKKHHLQIFEGLFFDVIGTNLLRIPFLKRSLCSFINLNFMINNVAYIVFSSVHNSKNLFKKKKKCFRKSRSFDVL